MIRKTSYYLSLLTLAASLCYLLVACQQPDKGIVKALPFHNGQENAWGLVNTDGSVCIPAGSFNVQPSAVVGDMFTLPSSQGLLQLYTIGQPATPVTLRTFTRIGYFFDKVTLAQETPNGPILIIDKEGHDISSTAQYPQYDIVQMHNFSNERALFVTREGKYGYMDTEGNVTIPPIYDIAYDFCEEVALVGMNNSQGETGYQLIDPDGQVTGNVRLSGCLLDTRFSSNKLLFKELHNGHLGFLNKQGDAVLYLPTSVLQASRFCHQTITIRTNKGTGCMDDKGQICIPSIYQDAFMADESRVAARHGNQWGLLNVSGKAITSFCFDTISHFYADGYAIVRDKTHYRFINRKGKLTDSSFAFIAEDSIAQRLKPQLFTITQESKGSTSLSSHLMSKATEEKQEKQPETTTGHTPLRASSHTQIENKDWKKITRRHPFYQEAAKVVSGKLKEQDSKNRRMILNYVEHLRTSYTTKDIDFLEQLFSENALIVVGTVVHTTPQKEANYLPSAQVVYNVKSKRQYLDRLKEVFKANQNIDVKFSKFHIMRHPTQQGIYGVSLRQEYHSDLYSDDGYLFLLWDFRDETSPKIHVRTWQPRIQPDHTLLPENEIFSIRNFNLQ